MSRDEWFKQVSRKVQIITFCSLMTDLKETKQHRVVRNENTVLVEKKESFLKEGVTDWKESSI